MGQGQYASLSKSSIALSDESFQARFQLPSINKPLIYCESHNIVQQMCINPDCKKLALVCVHEECKYCLLHQDCPKKSLQANANLLKKYYENQKHFYEQMIQIENDCSEMIKKYTIRMLENLNLLSKVQEIIKIQIDQIYKQNKFPENFYGKQAKKMNEQLNRITLYFQKEGQESLIIFKKESEKLTNEYINLKNQIAKININKKQKISPSLIKRPNLINQIQQSAMFNLLFDESQSKIKLAQFLTASLGEIKEMKLIFRASQQNFSSKKFHQICDYAPNTLVVARSQFGKTFGGFTPLTWNQQGNCGHFKRDNSLRSCLFQFNLMQKMSLKKAEYAIACNNHYGPCFGDDGDFGISNFCSTNKQSQCDFPNSYNLGNKYKQNSQEGRMLFCGLKKGKYFSVVDYEIFALSFG